MYMSRVSGMMHREKVCTASLIILLLLLILLFYRAVHKIGFIHSLGGRGGRGLIGV